MDQVQVTVEARDPGRVDDARRIAAALDTRVRSGPLHDKELRIMLLADGAELWDASSRKHGMPLSFAALDLRTGAGNLSRKQPLAKAIGTRATTVLDATGGWGHDAVLLACMGWTVTCVERVPLLAQAQALALHHAHSLPPLAEAIGGRLQLHHGDSSAVMRQLPQHDVIYLDPMFELRRGSALPKKPAQLLQRITGRDDDAPALLDLARTLSGRVVVKRPDDGQSLGPAPDLQFKGRLVRYDVYLQPDLVER